MKIVSIVVAVVLIGLLAGGYYLSGKEYVVRLSETQIVDKLKEKLPLTQQYLLVIQVTLDNPSVHLINGSKRVNAGLDVVFNVPLVPPINGRIDVSGGIRYLAERGQFFLTDPVVEDLEVPAIPAEYMEKFSTALTKALAAYYADHPIYTLNTGDVKQAAAKMVLKDVTVENRELVVTLGL